MNSAPDARRYPRLRAKLRYAVTFLHQKIFCNPYLLLKKDQANMPKTLLVKFYEGNQRGSAQKLVISTVIHGEELLVKVVMAKETHKLTKYAGWGLKALTFMQI